MSIKYKRKGFTIVELVIVIAVVGIVYKFSKPYYATLPEMKSDFTLDELPPA